MAAVVGPYRIGTSAVAGAEQRLTFATVKKKEIQ